MQGCWGKPDAGCTGVQRYDAGNLGSLTRSDRLGRCPRPRDIWGQKIQDQCGRGAAVLAFAPGDCVVSGGMEMKTDTAAPREHASGARVAVIVAACQSPGPKLAQALAGDGARVVVIDREAKKLEALARLAPRLIEPLVVDRCHRETLDLIRDTWGDTPLHLLVNLMPLQRGVEISEQMHALTALLRSKGRGLIAGRGALINVVRRPVEPLSLSGQGMCGAVAAAGQALARELAGHGVRVHTLIVPQNQMARAIEPLLFLGSERGQSVPGAVLDLS